MDLDPQKPQKKAKSFKRRIGQAQEGKELRRRIVYYLPAETKALMYEHIEAQGVKKREFIISCLQAYFADRKFKIWLPQSVTPFEERIFHFDEIPNDLWLRIDEATRDRSYRKVLTMSQIVEGAIALYLGIHETSSLYKTHKELRDDRKRKPAKRKNS